MSLRYPVHFLGLLLYFMTVLSELGLSVHTEMSSASGQTAGSTHTWVNAPAESSLRPLFDFSFLALQNKKGHFLNCYPAFWCSFAVKQLSSPYCLNRVQQPRLAFPAWDLALFYHKVFDDWWIASLFWLSCWTSAVRVIRRFLVVVFGQACLSQEHYLEIRSKWRSSSSSILKTKLSIFGSFSPS